MPGVVDGLNGNGDRADAGGWRPTLAHTRRWPTPQRPPASVAQARARAGRRGPSARILRGESILGLCCAAVLGPARRRSHPGTTDSSSGAFRMRWCCFFAAASSALVALNITGRTIGAFASCARLLTAAAVGDIDEHQIPSAPAQRAVECLRARDRRRPVAGLAQRGVKGDVGQRLRQVERGIRVNRESPRMCARARVAGNGSRDCPSGISRRTPAAARLRASASEKEQNAAAMTSGLHTKPPAVESG